MPTATRFPAGQRGGGRAVGIRHLNHSLSPPTPPWAKRGGGVLPIQGLGGWRVQSSPGPLRSTAPSPLLGKCISYSVCNAGPSPGDWGALGWPPMPGGGGGLGVICIEMSPKPGRRTQGFTKDRVPGALCGGGEGGGGDVHNRGALLREYWPCVLVPRRCPGSPRNPLLPLSHPCPPQPPRWPLLPAAGVLAGPPGAASPLGKHCPGGSGDGGARERRPHWVSCPVGWAQAPGCAHLVQGGSGGSRPSQSSSERR